MSHLVLMAFLQRIFNGGGQIIRDMAVGTGRLDICLIYDGKKYPIELKIRHSKKYVEAGFEQIVNYMDILNCDEGCLIIFDKRKKIAWNEKIYRKTENINGKKINIFGG
ncbi:MAG: hypothetical protein LBP59_08970, partial [Planctomycetaceae bacterium]|nr:hypothetical protein [Planctomycetaceae bacterium]